MIPTVDERSRLVLLSEPINDFAAELVIRQETLSDVGWFVQSRVRVEPEQLADLKLFFTSQSTQSAGPSPSQRSGLPHVVPFDRSLARSAG